MFDKLKQLGELNKLRSQAVAMQKAMAKEKIEIDERGVKVIINGNQQIETIEIDGQSQERITETMNKAIKKSQETAAKKLQQMGGGLSGLLKGAM